MPVGREGGGKEGRDEGMEDREKTCQVQERQRSSLHMFPCRESFSLPDLTFSMARIPPPDLPRRQCSIPLLGHKASVKCSVLIIYRTKGTQQSPSDSYLLKSHSRSCGRGNTDEESKGRGGVGSVWVSFF